MIRQKIKSDQLLALKSGDAKRLSILRYILSQIQNVEIDKKKELADAELIPVLKKINKELREAIDSFEKAGRDEIVKKNKFELAVVSSYLPAEIEDEELKVYLKKVIEQNKDLYSRKKEAVIGIAIRQLKDKADPARIIAMLRRL